MERYFPLFVNLTGKKILVIGAGPVATRRIRILLKFGCDIIVVAPDFCEEFNEIINQTYNKGCLYNDKTTNCNSKNSDEVCDSEVVYNGRLSCEKRCFLDSDLDGKDMVIIASNYPTENERIASLCKNMGIMKNVASDKSLCDFFFPSVVVTDDIVVGINSNGKKPTKTKETRIKIQKLLENNNG